MNKEKERIFEKEKIFHNKWAKAIDVNEIDVRLYFEGSTSPENRYIMSHIGSEIEGRKILDLGCGAGENSVYFALKGGICSAADYSEGMVKKAIELAERYGVTISGKVINAEKIQYPDNYFDIVYASNLLHHVNPEKTIREIHRVLKPGGKMCFWDPLKHNPIINIYRNIAKEVRTDDEKPLDIKIVNHVNSIFREVDFDTFWIASLWIFLRFFLIEKADPNSERYWKKIIYEETRLKPLYYRLEKIDKILKKIPLVNRMAWNIAVVAMK
jgi:ubiquinone/menaquinone biosynthesis C-methylase UbiE